MQGSSCGYLEVEIELIFVLSPGGGVGVGVVEDVLSGLEEIGGG